MTEVSKTLKERGFFWDNEIERIDESLEYTLECILESKTEREKEFFRGEYMRILGIKTEAIKNWIAVW